MRSSDVHFYLMSRQSEHCAEMRECRGVLLFGSVNFHDRSKAPLGAVGAAPSKAREKPGDRLLRGNVVAVQQQIPDPDEQLACGKDERGRTLKHRLCTPFTKLAGVCYQSF